MYIRYYAAETNEFFVLIRQVSGIGVDASAVGIRSQMAASRNLRLNEQIRGTGEAPRVNADAIFVRQPMEAQSRYQRKYITAYDKHHFPAYLVCRHPHLRLIFPGLSFVILVVGNQW